MANYNSVYTGLQIDTAIGYLDQTVKSGDSPTFVGTNFTGIPNGALTTNPLARANHTGTQTASTISDFDTGVSNNTDVASNTTHKTSDGSDHSFIDQSVVSGATPTFTGTNFSGIPNGALNTNPLARANHTGTQLTSTISDIRKIVPTYSATPSVNVANIQAALDLAGDGELPEYDVVYLPQSSTGVVEIDSPLYITTGVTFTGTGRKTILKASDSFIGEALIMLKQYDSTTYAEQFKISDMRIDGNKDSEKVACTLSNATNIIQDVAHGLSNGDKVRLVNSGGALPTELSKYLTYYVINKSDDDFQVSLISGGSAVTFTTDGTGLQYYYTFNRDGIKLDVPGGASYEFVGDNFSVFENLFIYNCSGNGIHHPSPSVSPQRAIAMHFNNIDIRTCGDSGIKTYASDNFYNSINSIANGYGYYIYSGNNSLVNCKSFYNDIRGIEFGTGSVGCKAVNFEAQEDLDIGVRFFDTRNVTVTNLVSESHGHTGDGSTSTGLGVGIEFSGAYDCHVQGVVNNRTALVGDIKYAVRFYGENLGNTIDIKIPDMNRPIPHPYIVSDVLSNPIQITNKLKIEGFDMHLPNLLEKTNKIIDTDGNNAPDGFTTSNQAGMTATHSYNANEKAQQVNITNNTDTSKAAKISMNIPLTGSSVLSVAMLGKCEAGLNFKVSVNVSSGSPSSSSYLATYGGNLIAGDTIAGYDWSILSNQTVHASTTFATIEFAVLANSTGVQDLDAYFRNIIITVHGVENTKDIWTWTATPSGEFYPQYLGQTYLDTALGKFYRAKGVTNNTDWEILN